MSLHALSAKLKEGNGRIHDLTLRPGDAENRSLREGAELEVSAPEGEGWSFLVDDEPLPLSEERIWHWSPGFFAGLVSAELKRGKQIIAAYRLEVSPHPDKLVLPLYQQMLDELVDVDPALVVGTEPATHKLGTLGSERDVWLEFRRLRMHSSDFLAALRQLMKRPIRTVRSSRRIAPLRAARRVDIQTVRSAAMMGALAALLPDSDSIEQTDHPGEPSYDLPWFEEHLDGPANRCITAMLLAVRRRALQLHDSLDRQVSHSESSETRTGLAARWPARRAFLSELIRHLKQIVRAEPFRSVSQPEISAAGLNAISAHPVYSRAYRCGWHAIRPGLRGLDASESIWLCPTWELYERWCFGKVVEQLRCLTGMAGQIKWDPVRCVWKAKTATGVRIQAHCQLSFTSTRSAEFHSISRERRPDIVITAKIDSQQRYMVLDAKYTQSRQGVLEAMASAHIYKDSLRWNAQRPWQALLTVPAGGGAPWLEEEEFMESEGVGVIILSPDDGDNQLLRQLGKLIVFQAKPNA